jgi:predicted transcriptional regulator
MTTAQDTVHSQGRSTYDVYFEIDCDCEELLDAIGLDYKQCEDDDTQNEVLISLDKDEYCDVFETIQFAKLNEQVIASRILNPELGEYTTKVSIYTPSGDRIIFF